MILKEGEYIDIHDTDWNGYFIQPYLERLGNNFRLSKHYIGQSTRFIEWSGDGLLKNKNLINGSTDNVTGEFVDFVKYKAFMDNLPSSFIITQCDRGSARQWMNENGIEWATGGDMYSKFPKYSNIAVINGKAYTSKSNNLKKKYPTFPIIYVDLKNKVFNIKDRRSR